MHGLREEKIGAKIGQKPAPLPPFLQFFSPSLSLPFHPPTRATTSSTTGSYPNHKPATPMPETTTVSSSLSLLQKSSSSPRGRLRPLLLAETVPERLVKPLDHDRDSCFECAAPPPISIFCNHFGCMQNVNHCSRSANNLHWLWARPVLAQPKFLGLVQPGPKNILGRDWPNHFRPISAHCFLGLCLAHML